jgi:hypothetical protein
VCEFLRGDALALAGHLGHQLDQVTSGTSRPPRPGSRYRPAGLAVFDRPHGLPGPYDDQA